MKKSRGQSLVDFVVLSLLAISIIIFGVYKFGDNIASFFQRNDVENKFNNARTVRMENPQDLVSSLSVKFDGIDIEPPVEKIIKTKLASGTYIQTSGSAGRLADMTEIMEEYADQLINDLITGNPEGTALKTSLTDFQSAMRNGTDGYMDKHDSYAPNQLLEKKLNFLKMAISMGSASYMTDVSTALTAYLPTIGVSNPVRKEIIETYTNDLLSFDNLLDYFIDPYLYVEYLGEEKRNTDGQDLDLVDKLISELGSLSQEEKQNIADLVKVFYGGGYSSASPTAYNSTQMCNTFSGTVAGDICTIAGP